MPVDPIRLEIYHQLLAAICEQAGAVLQRAAISPNIRERRDFSFALFDSRAQLVAQAAHIPVHLGSAGDSVRAATEELDLEPGDVVVLNDPYRGGTHLPDVTCVRPVFLDGEAEPRFHLVARAHHADVGGPVPGSMGVATELYGEGLVIPPVKLRSRGEPQHDVERLIFANVRGAEERAVDLRAQHAALEHAARDLVRLCESNGVDEVEHYSAALMDYAERLAQSTIGELRPGTHEAEDHLDGDGRGGGPLPIRLRLQIGAERLVFDWTGSADQSAVGLNANPGIVRAASVYVLRCLCPPHLPTNEGLFRVVDIVTRQGSLLDPRRPAAVAGGNVETSQRLVDTAFAALASASPERIPAASAGTMTNLTIGGSGYSVYETLPGGAGAGPQHGGESAVQTHMTNTRNTPVEELERHAPLRVERLDLRESSGGVGARSGGDGLIKEVRLLDEATISVFADRSVQGPPGREGGAAGSPFAATIEAPDGSRQSFGPKADVRLAAGSLLRIETPGGGGHGA